MITVINRNHHHNRITYVVKFHGTNISVTVTSDASAVAKWITFSLSSCREHLRMHQLVVGLGVQWTPGRNNPPADTLQLCIGRRVLIFQLAHANSVPLRLYRLLEHRFNTFVGFWNHSDRQRLELSLDKLAMVNDPLDLRRYSERLINENLENASVNEIVEKCLGYEVNQRREISRSNWSDEFMSEDQVVYACVDAYCAFRMGRSVRAWE